MLTTNEEQEYKILKTIIENNLDSFTIEGMPKILRDIIGGGAAVLLGNLQRDGFINLSYLVPDVYEINDAGRNRYKILRDKKNSDKLMTAVIWVTLLAALFSAVYAKLTYNATILPNTQQRPKPMLDSIPRKDTPTQTLLHDTIKDYHKSLSDSSKKN
jgi:hypothetical protein